MSEVTWKHQEEKYVVMINGDILNKEREVKIGQGEFTVISGQLPMGTYTFVTIFSSIFLFPYMWLGLPVLSSILFREKRWCLMTRTVFTNI